MEPQQRSFDTFARMLLTYQRTDMAPCEKRPEPPLHRYFAALHDDMLADPGAYRIPTDPFVTFFSWVTLTPEEAAQHEAVKATNLKVRTPIGAYFEFLRDLGMAGEADGANLRLPRVEFDRLVGIYAKKVRNRCFPAALARCGLTFSTGDPVMVANPVYPGMPAELAAFSRACARVKKEYGFYFFRRCDLAVLEGKAAPDIEAAVRMAPEPFRCDVAETDARLMQMRFRREMFVANYGSGYSLRYSKKSDQVVYWVRILESWHPDLHHFLYWKFKTDLTPRLLDRLEEAAPGLGNHVYEGLKGCIHCFDGYCMDRTPITWNGREKDVCKNTGWNKIGYEHEDYEQLWAVLGAVHAIL